MFFILCKCVFHSFCGSESESVLQPLEASSAITPGSFPLGHIHVCSGSACERREVCDVVDVRVPLSFSPLVSLLPHNLGKAVSELPMQSYLWMLHRTISIFSFSFNFILFCFFLHFLSRLK